MEPLRSASWISFVKRPFKPAALPSPAPDLLATVTGGGDDLEFDLEIGMELAEQALEDSDLGQREGAASRTEYEGLH